MVAVSRCTGLFSQDPSDVARYLQALLISMDACAAELPVTGFHGPTATGPVI